MELTRDDLVPHLGHRVLAGFTPPDDFCGRRGEFVLRFLPPTDEAIFADPGTGQETRVPIAWLDELSDARRPCAACPPGRLYNNVFLTGEEPPAGPRQLCADHYRGWAHDQPAPITVCDRCDSGAQAFYSPRTKVMACASCQGMGAGLTGLGVEARFLKVQNAECRAQPLDDLRHRWVHVRGRRYHCELCDAKRFTEPPQGTLTTR